MREINDVESQMMIIDLNIDGLLSSIVLSVFFLLPPHCLACFLCDSLFFSLASVKLPSFSTENDMEVQTGRCGHLQNEREAQGKETHTTTSFVEQTSLEFFQFFLSVTHCMADNL